MIAPKFCCDKPPLVCTDKNAFTKSGIVYAVVCTSCGRFHSSGDREEAVSKHNRAIEREAKKEWSACDGL